MAQLSTLGGSERTPKHQPTNRMEIHRKNHKWPTNPGRSVANADVVRSFKILEAGTEVGVVIEAKDLSHIWTVTLSPKETDLLIQSLLKKK